MNGSRLDVNQLQKRDPAAWTALLSSDPELDDVVATAVTAEPQLRREESDNGEPVVFRYTVSLAGHSDPITVIGKRTNRTETLFYRELAAGLATLAPRCWLAHVFGDDGWVVLDDVPDDFPPHEWHAAHVEEAISGLATLHAAFWDQAEALRDLEWLPDFIGHGEKRLTWPELRRENAVLFDEGPAAVISEHAINTAGRLAPLLLQAANGLVIMRDLGGWPGVLGESHLAAAADLLDDPLPMLQPLLELPWTLLHGQPHAFHWRSTLFAQNRLVDWSQAIIGPGIWDLVHFMERFDRLHDRAQDQADHKPASNETIIDSYLLAMSAREGRRFSARDNRQALPAARCLYVLATWFPHFAAWLENLPSKYTWQKLNRMPDQKLIDTPFQPMVGMRSHLAGVFRRFLRAYRSL